RPQQADLRAHRRLRPFRSSPRGRWRLLLGAPRPRRQPAPRLLTPVSPPMATRPPPQEGERRRLLYGRRRGRKLRSGQQGLMAARLPRLRVALPAGGAIAPAALFDPAPQAVWLEIGFGGGEHLAAQAAAHPEIGFIGCEIFENGIVKLLGEVQRA